MSYDFRILQGDLGIGVDGDLSRVEDTEKLIQDILKIAITPLGSNPYFPWYGSLVSKSMVGQAFDMEFTAAIASSQLQNSIETLQRLQQIQAERQRVTPFEQLAAIKRIFIERNREDPRFFSVVIKAFTRALSSIETGFNVRPTL